MSTGTSEEFTTEKRVGMKYRKTKNEKERLKIYEGLFMYQYVCVCVWLL